MVPNSADYSCLSSCHHTLHTWLPFLLPPSFITGFISLVLPAPSCLTSFPNQPTPWGSVPLLHCQDVLTTCRSCTSACQAAGPGSVPCLDLTTSVSVLADAAFDSSYPGIHSHSLQEKIAPLRISATTDPLCPMSAGSSELPGS